MTNKAGVFETGTISEIKPVCGKEMCEAYLKVVDELRVANKLTQKLDTVSGLFL